MGKLLAIFVMFFTACTVTQPVVSMYRIAPKMHHVHIQESSCHDKSLKIEQVFTTPSLTTTHMKYALENYEEFAFNQSAWVSTPKSAISEVLLQSIRSTGIFSNVSSFKSRSKTDYVLESNLDEFMQYFNKDNTKSYVKVRLIVSLLDRKNAQIIRTAEFASQVSTKSIDAKGGVEALNKALKEVLEKVNSWLYEGCE